MIRKFRNGDYIIEETALLTNRWWHGVHPVYQIGKDIQLKDLSKGSYYSRITKTQYKNLKKSINAMGFE